MKMEFHKNYIPLFQYKKYVNQRYFLISGSRASGKSTTMANFLVQQLHDEKDKVIVYARYILKNAESTIVKEVCSAIDNLGLSNEFQYIKSEQTLINTNTNSIIYFRGLKTSDGKNTAALKSISKISMFFLDEGEELDGPDAEQLFNTIDSSLRNNKTKNIVCISFNPQSANSFLHDRFYKDVDIEFNRC